MLLAAVLLFASCKKNNDSEKKQTCMLTGATGNYGETIKINYDDSGRISIFSIVGQINYTGPFNTADIHTSTYVYSPTQIIENYNSVEGNYNISYKQIYQLDGTGRIVSAIDSTYQGIITYRYNNEGYLAEITAKYPNEILSFTFTWSNGNLIGYKTPHYIFKYQYATQVVPSNFHLNYSYILPSEFIGALRSYFGKGIKNLPSSSSNDGNENVITYLNDIDGNLKSINIKDTLSFNSTRHLQYSCK